MALEGDLMADGWTIVKRNLKTSRVSKVKSHGRWLEDRVWTLMHRMGFEWLSGEGGATLAVDPRDASSPVSQLDVVGVDREVAVVFECKSAEKPSKRPQFQDELAKHASIRQRFAASVNRQFPADHKRTVALAMFHSNVNLSDNDRKRALEAGVVLFDEHDLEYYEGLVAHLGPAAKYQFLADLMPGKTVPGLELRIPAIRTKMGGYTCYTFAVSPAYLLKIAFVSHRAKGKASDVDTYQRMIRKSRLKSLQHYISADGVFPTNIVVSLAKKPSFDQIEQEGEHGSGRLGWLTLRPAFKSAWIIDGQHRLFAYSGHDRANSAQLAILAFDGLPPDKQAELFIDINGEQKSVKQSLLQELYAELHWNADDPGARVRAIVSKAVLGLNDDRESPFAGRILAVDEQRDLTRCITLGSMYKALLKPELYVVPARKNGPLEYGSLWAGDDQDATRLRTMHVLNEWFDDVRSNAEDWWGLGAADGGGLAMNDGVTACIDVLRSVLTHLDAIGQRLVRLTNEDLSDRLKPYSRALGSYLGGMSIEERKSFRDLRGVQGITTRTRRAQNAIHHAIPSFNPPGLQEHLELEKAQTNQQAKSIIDRLEATLQRTILEELRREFAIDENQWWYDGIPETVRLPASKRLEEDRDRRGGREFYFDLIDYRTVILSNWTLLGELFGFAEAGNGKDKRTSWLAEVNDVRKIVSHVSSGRSVSLEQLDRLATYDQWLQHRVTSTFIDSSDQSKA